ncbi:MAG: D-alanyl-D-alanine carboxypeptidase/D-alanyl-D-alanine-endopeptidase [Nocardioidaceae bacterium]
MPQGDADHVAASPDGPPEDPPSDEAPVRRHRRGRWVRRTTAALVVLVLVAAGATYELDLGSRWFGRHRPSPVTAPAEVLPPAGLRLPAARRAAAVATPRPEGTASAAAVRRAVASLVASRKLGRHVVVVVAQLSDGRVVYRHGKGPVTPASTMKLLTAVAALATLGPLHRFTTSVVLAPSSNRVVLVGGGDPLLTGAPAPASAYPARANLVALAARTAAALKSRGRTQVRLGYDTSLFSGPSVDPQWEPSYVPEDVVSPVTPLWVDEGRAKPGLADRSPDPALAATKVFAGALEQRHIRVLGTPSRAVAPPASAGGRRVAAVRSAPLAEIVQHIVEASDNEGAETLSRQVAVARGESASFVGGARAVRGALRRLGISTRGDRIYDGSGLSRHDRLEPDTLLSVIRAAASSAHPGLRSAVSTLPVAGFTGSLAARFRTGDPAGRGTVRAKTGTLNGVHGLAGTVTTQDGVVLGFVAVADRVRPENTLDARSLLDRVAAALGGCRCRG